MFSFENLKIYEESLSFTHLVYKLTKSWPRSEMFGLIDQFQRASVSISLNIAEGTSRTKKDFQRFLDMARGSCFECVAIARIALNEGYLDKISFNQIYLKCEIISKMISGLKKSMGLKL